MSLSMVGFDEGPTRIGAVRFKRRKSGSPGFRAFRVFPGLRGDIHADLLRPGFDETSIHGTGTPRADRLEVEAGDGNHADGGRRVPRFFGFAHVVGFDIGFADRDVQPFRKFHAGLSGDAAQDIVGPGREDFAIEDDEDVVAGAFGDESMFVGEQGVGPVFHALRLQIGKLVVDPAAVFCFRVNVAGGYRLLGRHDKMSTPFVIVSRAADVSHERDDVDGDDRTQSFPDERVVQGKGAPGDVVHDLVVQAFQ